MTVFFRAGLVALWAMAAAGCLESFPRGATSLPTHGASKRRGETPSSKGRQGPKKDTQSYAQAWQRICHAERLAGVDPKTSRDVRSTRVAEWINQQVKNKKARYWWIAYAKLKKAQREQFFRAEAKQAGLVDCPLVTLLFGKPPTTRDARSPTGKRPAGPKPAGAKK